MYKRQVLLYTKFFIVARAIVGYRGKYAAWLTRAETGREERQLESLSLSVCLFVSVGLFFFSFLMAMVEMDVCVRAGVRVYVCTHGLVQLL